MNKRDFSGLSRADDEAMVYRDPLQLRLNNDVLYGLLSHNCLGSMTKDQGSKEIYSSLMSRRFEVK